MTDREKFEVWAKANTKLFLDRTQYPMTDNEDQQYIDHDTNLAFMAWQAALASQQPADDGWIAWGGGECPVSINARVYVRFRDGEISEDAEIAGLLRWTHVSADWDIVAYRVVKP